MALPTGQISMSQIRNELKLSGSLNLGHSRVRGLAGRTSGSISMSHLRGKSDKKWVFKRHFENANTPEITIKHYYGLDLKRPDLYEGFVRDDYKIVNFSKKYEGRFPKYTFDLYHFE